MKATLLVISAEGKLEWSPISGNSGIYSIDAREIKTSSKTLWESGILLLDFMASIDSSCSI
jgi:hypothetical protein